MNRVRRIVSLGLMIVIAYLLQTVIFPQFMYQSPNVLLIVVVFLGVMNEQYTGIIMGFVSGLILDCTFGNTYGVYALIYMSIGYISSLYNRNFYGNSLMLPTGLLAVMDLCYGLTIYLVYYFMRHGVHVFRYLSGIIVPEIIYTVFVGILFYKLIYEINSRTL